MAEIFIINNADDEKQNWGEKKDLSRKGIAQAYVLNHIECLSNITKVEVSDSKSAKQTAKIAFPEADTITNKAFDEISYGDMDGLKENPFDRMRFTDRPEDFLESHYGSDIEESVARFDKAILDFNEFLDCDSTIAGAVISSADIMRLWFAKRKCVSFTTGLKLPIDGCQIIYFNPDRYLLKIMPGFKDLSKEGCICF